MKKERLKIFNLFIFLIIVILSINFVFAWTFNGTIRDVDGNLLNNTLVNITFWMMGGTGPSLVGSNSTTSNALGVFNFSVYENSSYMYQPVVRYTNATTGAIDYIGQSLPQFPYAEFANTTNLNFYLRPAGTINITAINSSGHSISFRYQVKDTKLGYPIAGEFTTPVSQATVYVPRDRNYSIMVYPNQAMPVSFNWNNFTATSSYDIVTGLSTYNVTTHTVNKKFNSTDNLIRVTGYINRSGIIGWNEFTVVPFLLEPGNMIYLGDNAGMPYNMSAWRQQSDEYNLTSGNYNITLPGPAESANYILFATARNESGYYGGYRNITLNYSSSSSEFNFTMYPLMSTNWATTNNNLTLNDASSWQTKVNISSAKQQFNLINSSNITLSSLNAHLEIKVDYSSYGAREFTFMSDISSGSGSFYLPLLNVTGIKEINIYSQSYSPKRVGTKTSAQILANSNITLSTFNPGDIDGTDIMSSVSVALYQSNSTCNLPNPADSCIIADSASMDPNAANSFNPLSSIIGGGKLNFKMGLLTSGIIVEYINVDMLASGPPDALFDDSATTSTSSGFDSAMRFGSNGPTIYDYVIISMPYTEGNTSTTGLNENADVNMSIPILYDENWNVIWNASANGTNGTALAGNQSHYSTYSSQWQTLMGENNCTKNKSSFNLTNPCYIDTADNRIWIRLPHFSGTKPSVTGSVITATAATAATPATSSGSSSIVSKWVKEIKLNGSELNLGQTLKQMKTKYRATFNVSGLGHYVGITNITNTTVIIEVASTPQTATLSVGETKKFDVNADGYYDVSVSVSSITYPTTNLVLNFINEKIATTPSETTSSQDGENTAEQTPVTEESVSMSWLVWIIIGAIILLLIIAFIYYYKTYHK